jgi:predicted ATP-dependent serine protease
MWSSYRNLPLTPSLRKEGGRLDNPVFIGEVSLLGEVKKVRGWEKRVKEAEGLGRRVVEMKGIGELKR